MIYNYNSIIGQYPIAIGNLPRQNKQNGANRFDLTLINSILYKLFAVLINCIYMS